jgi:hypothetical protein
MMEKSVSCDSPAMPAYPRCASFQTVKNGHVHNGKQRFKCHDWGRQFVEQPTKKVIEQPTWELIDRLLLERISLAGIGQSVPRFLSNGSKPTSTKNMQRCLAKCR